MIYAFDDCALDTGLLELRRGGAPVRVEPQVFELLALLISARDRVVLRDEILARVWGGRIVSDAAVSSRVRDARRAIGDDGAAQRLIRTVQRRGFRFVGEAREVPAAPAAPPAEPAERLAEAVMRRPAIAVLPFADATDGLWSSYLADAVTEELTATLGAWRAFPVISRNTAFRYRAADLSARELGRALGARYLVTGTLQRGRDRVKLSAALVDAEADRERWSGRLVRPLDEPFALEEALAERVATMLMPELRAAEMHRILRKRPEDMTAWDLAMRASWCVHRAGEAEFAEAERLAAEAAAREPGWRLPHTVIAYARFRRAMRAFTAADARTAFADTLAAAKRALEIDAGSWRAQALAGVGELWCNRHHDRALDHVDRAIALNPSAAEAHHFAGCIAGLSGDPAGAERRQRRVFRIDPAHPFTAVVEADLGLWRMLEGDLEEAARRLDRAVQWDPGCAQAHQRRVALAGLAGDRPAAARAAARLAEIGRPLDRAQLLASHPFRREAHRNLFFDGLRRAGVSL